MGVHNGSTVKDRVGVPVLRATPHDLLANGPFRGSFRPQGPVVHVADKIAEIHPVVDDLVLHVLEEHANRTLVLDVEPQPHRDAVRLTLEVIRDAVDEALCRVRTRPRVWLRVVEAREHGLAVGPDRVVVERVGRAHFVDPATQAARDSVNSRLYDIFARLFELLVDALSDKTSDQHHTGGVSV